MGLLHQGKRRLLRRTGLTGRRSQSGCDRTRPAVDQGPSAAGRMTPTGTELPTFPWDTIAEQKDLARAHPDGIVDLSVGTPVDPVAPRIRDALAAVSDVPGYPATHGTVELRTAALEALSRRHGVTGIEPDAVLPTIGSKEMVAWLPTLLGDRKSDV